MTDTDKLCAEIRAGLEGLPSGPWEVDSEKQTDAPDKHLEYALFGKDGERLCDTGNSDSGSFDVEYDDYGATVWNETSRVLMDHIARCSPENIRAILDRLEAAEAENKRLREALRPFASVAPDDVRTGIWHHFGDSSTEILTPADFERARAALEAK